MLTLMIWFYLVIQSCSKSIGVPSLSVPSKTRSITNTDSNLNEKRDSSCNNCDNKDNKDILSQLSLKLSPIEPENNSNHINDKDSNSLTHLPFNLPFNGGKRCNETINDNCNDRAQVKQDDNNDNNHESNGRYGTGNAQTMMVGARSGTDSKVNDSAEAPEDVTGDAADYAADDAPDDAADDAPDDAADGAPDNAADEEDTPEDEEYDVPEGSASCSCPCNTNTEEPCHEEVSCCNDCSLSKFHQHQHEHYHHEQPQFITCLHHHHHHHHHHHQHHHFHYAACAACCACKQPGINDKETNKRDPDNIIDTENSDTKTLGIDEATSKNVSKDIFSSVNRICDFLHNKSNAYKVVHDNDKRCCICRVKQVKDTDNIVNSHKRSGSLRYCCQHRHQHYHHHRHHDHHQKRNNRPCCQDSRKRKSMTSHIKRIHLEKRSSI